MKEIDLITECLKEQIAEEMRKAAISILVYELQEKIETLWIRKQREEKKELSKPCPAF